MLLGRQPFFTRLAASADHGMAGDSGDAVAAVVSWAPSARTPIEKATPITRLIRQSSLCPRFPDDPVSVKNTTTREEARKQSSTAPAGGAADGCACVSLRGAK